MRWRKGTNDQDGDGRKGGSLPKETSMAKAPAKKAAAKTKAATTDKTAVEAAQSAAATTMDPQTGMSVQRAEKPTKAAIEAQFKEADAKGQPDDVAEATLSRAIRGW